jgi:outer membrane protein assembly factor BamB
MSLNISGKLFFNFSRYFRFLELLLLLSTFISLATPVTAANMMFRADAQHTGVYDNGGIEPTNTELWRFLTVPRPMSSPTIAKGVVYIRNNDAILFAIDAVTGKKKWSVGTGEYGLLSDESSPAVVDGTVYVGSYYSTLYAIDAETGEKKWDSSLYAYDFTQSESHRGAIPPPMGATSPTVSNGVVYIGSSIYVIAIDAMTGKEKWNFETKGYIESSPAVSDGVVYIGSNEAILYAIDASTGKLKWQSNPDRIIPEAVNARGGIISSPAVSNSIIYIVCLGNTYAIDSLTGKVRWQFKAGDAKSSPAVSNGVVYIRNVTNLYAIDADTGQEKWHFSAPNNKYSSSPAVSNGVIYIGGEDTNLIAINAVTGKENWRFDTDGPQLSSPAIANGVVYITNSEGYLFAIGGSSGQPSRQTPKQTPRQTPAQASSMTSITGNPTLENIPVTDTPNLDNPTTILPLIIVITVILCCGAGYGIYRIKRKSKDQTSLNKKPLPQRGADIIPSPQEINNGLDSGLKYRNADNHHDVFISYSNKDKPVADAICSGLESHSIRCWIAPRDVLSGEDFPKAIIQAISNSKIMVLIFSAQANTSPHVARELIKAVQNEVIIIPFRIEDVPLSESMEYLLGLPHWLDALTPPLEKHIDILIQRVSALLENRE